MNGVRLADSQLLIDQTPRVLLSASVFGFRIDPDQWADRFRAVKALGYHAIDVYFPWNFHEAAPGKWDFSGRRDAGRFLDLAAQAGLYVIARPGPYICCEWDSGGLPAWLPLIPGLQLRQNEPVYLAEVERWFDQIIPVLAKRQHGAGGSVILVQVENELDFFDCEDPPGYLDALAKMALERGIEVPIIGCAGQGDLARASSPLVFPAANLYPADASPDVEALAGRMGAALAERGLPLLATETNRQHRTLKRIAASGAKLLGPYLQTSCWNFDYGTSVNNWGDVLGFMTADYDFAGVIDPAGGERPDAAEARRLAGVIDALGVRLAAGRPGTPPALEDGAKLPTAAIDLDGGGQLYSLAALEATSEVSVQLGDLALPVTVPAQCTLLLVGSLPVGVGAELAAASAELVGLETSPRLTRLVFAARRAETVVIRTGAVISTQCAGDIAVSAGPQIRISGSSGTARVETENGLLEVVLQSAEPQPAGWPGGKAQPVKRVELGYLEPGQGWTSVAGPTEALPLEHFGVFNGNGRYRTPGIPAGTLGMVLREAADVIAVRLGDQLLDWRANGGSDLWLPFGERVVSPVGLEVTARIWGHSNFDDGRLPSLRLGSLRGISGAVAVTRAISLDEGWEVAASESSAVGVQPPPSCRLGGWMTANYPQTVTYRRRLPADAEDALALHLSGGACRIDVGVDGIARGRLTPLCPTLFLGQLDAGAELTATVTRTWGEPVGNLELLVGAELGPWTVQRQATPELLASRAATPRSAAAFPVAIGPGAASWAHIAAGELGPFCNGNAVIRMRGEGLHVTAFSGNANLGRVWLGGIAGAALRGGRGDLLLVPASEARYGLDLYLEATRASGGVLESVTVGGPVDRPDKEEL
ncbi:MAG: beta-galactosidase [Propionibacteriaceae bacterium]|jgi:hypothetical protein|nr:beta-galactosidase [Propionibacteriaceae bacterium]